MNITHENRHIYGIVYNCLNNVDNTILKNLIMEDYLLSVECKRFIKLIITRIHNYISYCSDETSQFIISTTNEILSCESDFDVGKYDITKIISDFVHDVRNTKDIVNMILEEINNY